MSCASSATAIYVMNAGAIVEAGPARDVLNHPQNEYTARLLDAVY